MPQELPEILKGKDLSRGANERLKFCVVYCKTQKKIPKNWMQKGLKILIGDKAKAFLKKQNFEKIKIEKKDFVEGTCACPGNVKGVVKIVNVTQDMGKVHQGDIMVSMKTYPAFVPAMKKASAIVTEDGGITCHAAIVARELQTPCVVGCRNATSIFCDGDFVQVDAGKGVVRLAKEKL